MKKATSKCCHSKECATGVNLEGTTGAAIEKNTVLTPDEKKRLHQKILDEESNI